MARRYRDAADRLQQNVQKHLNDMKELSSSEDEDPYEASILVSIFQSYCRGGGDTNMLNRTKNLLEEAISGRSVTCLICIGSIKKSHAIWTCDHCFSYFHLSCIQKWSNDSITLRSEESTGPIAVIKQLKIEWCCPKCRNSYSKEEIPRKYRCFCGKTDDPEHHPWLIPHTCGEICGKRLSTGGNCEHKCLLLCHPGPCPPCPQTVNGICYCQKERKKVRCSAAKWSCGQVCKKTLFCNTHSCENVCHPGDCPQCSYASVQPCQCGSERTQRPCNDTFWQCKKPCNKLFSCSYHNCEKICHWGDCGDCPNSGMLSCPCGANQRFVQCPDVMETCLGTCGKKHRGCAHRCPEKCHNGNCPPCQVLVEKKCHCSTHTRSLPCSKDFKCETKCRGMRLCGKHGCGRKCCNGNCPPCEKICDKGLQCGRHRCTNICHRGPCYPCPLESKVACKCKETYVRVACGRERQTKPPKCNLPCQIRYKCFHTSEENKHKCHFGDCPPCKAICSKQYPKCGHKCKAVCHEYVAVVFKQVEKPATPWEVQPPKTKIMTLECPPCDTPVPMVCLGEHETNNQPCHSATRSNCGRQCGRPLSCGNHQCTLLCHLHSPVPEYSNVSSTCKQCDRDCLIPRPEKCTHTCPIGVCHPGPCPPCDILDRVPCHCGLTQIYMRCRELSTATEIRLSCKQQCPKNLDCGHRCRKVCHSGACGDQLCTRKTKVYCPCGNVKREAPCNFIRNGEIKVLCDETCEAKKTAAKIEQEKEKQRLKEIEEEKNRKELAEYEWKLSGKKKKYKEKKMVVGKDDRGFFKRYWVPMSSFLVMILAAFYYIFYVEGE